MNKFFVTFLLFFTIAPLSSYCQECEPMDPFCDEDPDTPIPIDSGVSLLIGAGTLYAIKKLKSKKRDDTNKPSE